MLIDQSILSPLSALFGALVGGSASLIAAIYNQRHGERIHRVVAEITKRETVYSEFVMNASHLLLKAYVNDEIELSGEEQRLIGLINRMRIFASPEVVTTAEAVLRSIVEISLKPSVKLRELAKEALTRSPDPDPLLTFSLVCRADLEDVRRTTL